MCVFVSGPDFFTDKYLPHLRGCLFGGFNSAPAQAAAVDTLTRLADEIR